MASRRKKSRLSVGFIAKTVAALGIAGGGGYGAVNSSMFSGEQPAVVATAVTAETEELKTAHGPRLIAEFGAHENNDAQIAELLAGDTEKSAPKNVLPAGFQKPAADTSLLTDLAKKPPTQPSVESGNLKAEAKEKPAVSSFAKNDKGSFKAKPSENGFKPKASPKPEKPPAVAKLDDIKPIAKPIAKPETKPSSKLLNEFLAKKDDVPTKPEKAAEKPQNKTTTPPPVVGGSFGDKPPTSSLANTKPPAVQPPVAKATFNPNGTTGNGFTAKANSQPAPIIPQTRPKSTAAPFANAAKINDRPERDPADNPNRNNDLLKQAAQPRPQSSQTADTGPRVVPKPIDAKINNQFSSAGSIGPGVTNPASKPPTKPAVSSKTGPPVAKSIGDQGNLAGNRTLGNTFGATSQSAAQSPQQTPPPRIGNNQPNTGSTFATNQNNMRNQIPANNASTASTGPTNNTSGRPRPLNGNNTGLTSVSTNANPGILTATAGNTPGDRGLEGIQSPTLSLEKSAPREIQVGRPATFRLIVRNNGRVPAYGVTVVDEVPKGTQLQSTRPNPAATSGSKMTWNLGTLQPGDSSEIVMELVPQERGEIGSVAQVSFQSQASVRTICTKPQLEIQHSAPGKILIGDTVDMRITIRNTGDGAATGVMIEENIPENMVHADSNGRKLQYPVGTLAPGESRQLTLRLRAEGPGQVRNNIAASGDGKLFAKDELDMEIVSPELQLDARGPSRRYIERQATYDLAVANLGTASATNVQMVARLPRGLKFVETDKNGQYDARTHAVYWSLIELPPESKGEVKLTLLPIDTGQQKIDFEANADLNISQAKEMLVAVEQYSELFFDVDDVADPIEVGSDTVYHIRVVNQGSKPATNVKVQVRTPESLQTISASGPTQHQISGEAVVFAPIERLAPNAEAKFEIQVKGNREGDHRITVQLSSNERSEVVAKEESTKVYSDYR